MLISKVHIVGYRNLRDIEVDLNRLVILIGDNNSGKSNFLKAITLPFMNDETGKVNKRLGWNDINNDIKKKYFTYIEENLDKIKNDSINKEEFQNHLPFVRVTVTFQPDDTDEFYVRKWINSIDGDDPIFSIQYEFSIENPKELFEHIKNILKDKDSIDHIKMNLLPIELFKYSITNPATGDQVSYADLINFKYNSLAAERDDFSQRNQLGSRSLVNLLQSKLSDADKVKVEESYETFFNELKEISDLDDIFNWQTNSSLENATEFFDKISLLPNMPSMSSLFNNVRLGFGEEYLYDQGLGYRNLVYLFVMMNSLEVNNEIALNILTIEEPEAHLSVSNERLLASFIQSITNKSEKIQLFLSTHSPEFLDKLQLENVIVVTEGTAFSLKSALKERELDYLAKKPNLDFLKFLYSRRCILVEGPTEEMLIKSYLRLQSNVLNDIAVISLHKGFTNMLEIWLKVNKNTSNRIAVIRDYDDEPAAQKRHEKYCKDNENIYVATTEQYTLEPEIVNTEGNYEKLKAYFKEEHNWKEEDLDTPDALSKKWENAKTDTMLKFCLDFGKGHLEGIKLPQHINKSLNFLKSGVKE